MLPACFLAADVCPVFGRVVPLNTAVQRCVTIFTTRGYLPIAVGSSSALAELITNAVCNKDTFLFSSNMYWYNKSHPENNKCCVHCIVFVTFTENTRVEQAPQENTFIWNVNTKQKSLLVITLNFATHPPPLHGSEYQQYRRRGSGIVGCCFRLQSTHTCAFDTFLRIWVV